MTSCEHPECREEILLELSRKADREEVDAVKRCAALKVSKKAMWGFLVAVGLPLFAVGINAWSDQASNKLKFASREELSEHAQVLQALKERSNVMISAVSEIKEDQRTIRQDIKEIRRYLRDMQ